MKTVYGVGINDLKGLSQSKFYQTWKHMLQRCYCEEYQKTYQTYIGCSVCDDWLIFSNFKTWMANQDWEGKQLDKDILVPGNKVYSPETCVFLDQEINLFLTESNAIRVLYPIGVSFHKASGKFQSRCRLDGKQINLGYYNTAEEAHLAWKSKKLELARVHASKQSDPRITEALEKRYFP